MAAQQGLQRGQRSAELRWQDRANDTMSGDDFAIQRLRDPLRRIDCLAAEGIESGYQNDRRAAHGNAKNQISNTLIASSHSAVGTCARITPFGSRSSSKAAGTMLKFAAIGVSKVPQ